MCAEHLKDFMRIMLKKNLYFWNKFRKKQVKSEEKLFQPKREK